MDIAAIHASNHPLVIAVTGGGSEAIARLLTIPGASRTVLEAIVPYSSQALADFLGRAPEQYCSSRTARAMAMVAFLRARQLADPTTPVDRLLGIGCTAALATDRPKAGPHRAHLALQSAAATYVVDLDLAKGLRSRAEEESLLADLLLQEIARACGAAEVVEREERLPGDKLGRQTSAAKPDWRALLLGEVDAVAEGIGRPAPSGQALTYPVLFPGAFNPLHEGHRQMAATAAKIAGSPVEFEISLTNVDKPPLDYMEIESRLAQFGPDDRVWLTRAPTFVEKAALFPGATFVVGADTIVRIADPKYCGGDSARVELAIDQLAASSARFLVFGRLVKGRFESLADLSLPVRLTALCTEIPPSEFRLDISSTELRRQADE